MEIVVFGLMLIALFIFGCYVMDRFSRFLAAVYRRSSARYLQSMPLKKKPAVLNGSAGSYRKAAAIEHVRDIYGQDTVIVVIEEDPEFCDEVSCGTEPGEDDCL